MQLYLDQLTDDLRLPILLEHTSNAAGTYVSVGELDKLDNLLLKQDVQKEVPMTFEVTGTTDSKFYAILNSIKALTLPEEIVKKRVGNQFGEHEVVKDFDVKRFLNQPIRIPGTDITATITNYTDEYKEYIFYSDTDQPIKYIDFPDSTTTFIFSRTAEEIQTNAPLLNKFSGLVEAPKIESSVFIERGIVNVFEPFKKLKKVKTLNEMTKFGFGYYKINKQGFNFKNL